jgi:hypothetical protein
VTYDQLIINIQSMIAGDSFWVNAQWFRDLVTHQNPSAFRVDYLMKKCGVVMELRSDGKLHFIKKETKNDRA